MRFRSRQLYAGPRLASVIVASLAASVAFAQLNMRSMPPVFIEHTQKHEPNLRFETGPATTISTFSFFPQIDNWVSQKLIFPENPRPNVRWVPGVPNTLVPGGTTGRGTSISSALFPGMIMAGLIPPDPHMAVGPGHVVQVVNTAIAFFKKSDGQKLFQQTLASFFGPVSSLPPGFDPRVFYDQHNERFLVLALETNTNDISKIVIAASDDSDPNGNWNLLEIDSLVDVNNSDHWFDYPMPGYNADALVINGNLFAAGFGGSQSYVVPTAGLYDGTGVTVTGFFVQSPSSIQGAGNMGAPSDTIYGLSTGFGTGSTMRIFAWRNLTGTPTLVSTGVGVPNFTRVFFVPTRGGGSLDAISARMMDANYRDGFIVGAHTVAVTNDVARGRIQWYEFATNNWPSSGLPTLAQAGEIVLDANDSAIQPAINKNVFGDISILFTRSSPNITADAMIVSRVVTDPDGTMGTPVQIAGSIGTWPFFRWGDYFAVVTDPNDDATFWGNGEGVDATGRWTTEIQSWTVTIGGGGQIGTNYDATAIAANKFPSANDTYGELLGTHFNGGLAELIASDNGFFDVDSAFLAGQGHYGSIRADFSINEPASTVTELGITVEAHLSPGKSTTGTIFAFNWTTNTYQYIRVISIKSTGNVKKLVKIKKDPGNFVSSGGQVRFVIRAHDPFRRRGRNPEPFRLRVDLVRLNVRAT